MIFATVPPPHRHDLIGIYFKIILPSTLRSSKRVFYLHPFKSNFYAFLAAYIRATGHEFITPIMFDVEYKLPKATLCGSRNLTPTGVLKLVDAGTVVML